MKLKSEIQTVLTALGAQDNEITALIEHFAAKAAQAYGEVAQIEANIASLQVQLAEAKARVDVTMAGVLKFVTVED
jgi:ABC-type transporter Mla subunit MlaD